MKFKMTALILALTVVAWAQTATPTAPAAPQQSTAPEQKAKCPCCDKMAMKDAKDAHSCCMHHEKDASGKETASCCGGKDAMSCMKGDKDKTAHACCGDKCSKDAAGKMSCAGKCAKECEKGCCSAKNKSEKAA